MLSPFEYITILISIILGLGIAQLVTGMADIIYHWDRVKLYWPHILWIPIVFFLHIQEWWNIYALRDHDTWMLPLFLFIILYPINLFILARLLFPISLNENTTLDYKHFYFNHYRRFFLVLAFSAFLSGLENVLISGLGFEGVQLQLAIIIILLFISLRRISSEWVHKLLLVM